MTLVPQKREYRLALTVVRVYGERLHWPHVTLSCDFDFVTAGSGDPWLSARAQTTHEFSMQHYVNTWRDLILTLTKRD